jgi:predicted TIM-barrel fold metal-dependent hydrolase
MHPRTGNDTWRIGNHWALEPGWYAAAGWREYPPKGPSSLDEEGVDRGTWDPVERLKRMDDYGVYAQVLYPNIIAFEVALLVKLDLDVSLACVRAWNDYIIEFASVDPKRLIPVSMVPFWDVDASVAEIKRCRDIGHKGMLFANKYERMGLPPFWDSHWDRIYAVAQEADLSINFHVSVAEVVDGMGKTMEAWRRRGSRAPPSVSRA